MTNKLYLQSTPFVGREKEIEQLQHFIEDADCRLITVVGPGGVGKTRLALEFLKHAEGQFDDDVYFITLQPLSSSADIPDTVADALGLTMDNQDTVQQLTKYLETKNSLLILDNFEHVLTSDSIQFITRLLDAAPQIKILITSRERLNLREEWLLPLQGLQVPTSAMGTDLHTYDAIHLFADYAQRVRPDFSLKIHLSDVIRICQQIEGLPLAIELAASWLRYMTCEQVATEITENVASLQTTLRNVPERHRSMEAVFDQTWEMLTEIEQDTFTKLTIFQGSFERSAALYVSEADLLTLTSLVDKSLLQTDATGRYRIHELLRQYGDTKLHKAVRKQIQHRFCKYYADFLFSQREQIMEGGQIEAMNVLRAELDNIRMAWRQAIVKNNPNFFKNSAQTLSLFYQFTSRFAEGSELFGKAVQSLNTVESENAKQALVYLQVDWGWFDIRLGHLERAESNLLDCLEVYQQLNIPPVFGHGSDPRLPLGVICSIRGQYDDALSYGDEAYQIADKHNHAPNLCFADWLKATTLFALGNLPEAEQKARRAYTIAAERQDHWFMAYCLNVQGNIARALGKFDEAERHYLESYHIREGFEDPEGMAVALNHLGQIALMKNDIERAQRYYRQSSTLYQELHDRGGLADVQIGLGTVALRNEQYVKAQRFFREALITTLDIHHLSMTFKAFIHIADLFHQTGYDDRSRHLLHIVRDHPDSDKEAQENAKQLLTKLTNYQQTDVDTRNWQSIAVALINDLDKTSGITLPSPQDELIEPLTERELEVLNLLAEGMSNQDIAEELTVVVGTVKAHNHSIYGKLDVKNRTEAVTRARELNFI